MSNQIQFIVTITNALHVVFVTSKTVEQMFRLASTLSASRAPSLAAVLRSSTSSSSILSFSSSSNALLTQNATNNIVNKTLPGFLPQQRALLSSLGPNTSFQQSTKTHSPFVRANPKTIISSFSSTSPQPAKSSWNNSWWSAPVPEFAKNWSTTQRVLAGTGATVACAAVFLPPSSLRDHNPLPLLWGLARLVRVYSTAALIAADYKWSLWGSEEGSPERRALLSQLHWTNAKRMLGLFQALGGFYIKTGQQISSLDHILPEEYTSTMSVLQDQCRPSDFDEVLEVLIEELGDADPSQVFSHFDPVPIAAGSLAQVHHATLLDGTEVAVKIQYPGLRESCAADIVTIDFLVSLIPIVFPGVDFQWLVEEFKRNAPLELDFHYEAKNSKRTAQLMKDGGHRVVIPRVVDHLTTSRLLVAEYMPGIRVTDVDALNEAGYNPAKITTILTQAFADMIFISGFVHCDPHPGNVLVRTSPVDGKVELVLLDHGLYRELSHDVREAYASLWKALLMGDDEKLVQVSKVLCPDSDYRVFLSVVTGKPWDSTSVNIDEELTDDDREAIAVTGLVPIATVLSAVPTQILLLFKANDLLRHVNRELKAGLATSTLSLPYALRGAGSEPRAPGVSGWVRSAWSDVQVAFRLWVVEFVTWISRLFGAPMLE